MHSDTSDQEALERLGLNQPTVGYASSDGIIEYLKDKNKGNEDEIRKRLIWKCELCEDVVISYSHLRHQMNTCDCGKTSVDMEEFYTRILGDNFVFISEKVFENGKWRKEDES